MDRNQIFNQEVMKYSALGHTTDQKIDLLILLSSHRSQVELSWASLLLLVRQIHEEEQLREKVVHLIFLLVYQGKDCLVW